MRAIRSALLARLPLLVGLCRFDLLLAVAFAVRVFELDAPLVLVAVFFLFDEEWVAAGLSPSDVCPETGGKTISNDIAAAMHRNAG